MIRYKTNFLRLEIWLLEYKKLQSIMLAHGLDLVSGKKRALSAKETKFQAYKDLSKRVE